MGISIGGGISSASGGGKASGCGAYAFGGIFAIVGLVGTVALAWGFLKNLDTWRWEKAPATLHRCEVGVTGSTTNPSDKPFHLDVEFEYTHGTEVFRSTTYQFSSSYESSYEKLARTRARLLKKRSLHCFVNPADPTEAVLMRGSLWLGFFIVLPLIFLAIGVFVIRAAVKEGKGIGRRSEKRTPISEKAGKKKMSPAAAFVLFAILAAAGLGALVPFVKTTLYGMVASKGWVELPCEIIWSRVVTHDGDDGDTYSVDIFYRYSYNGAEHRSNRYNFSFGSSSGRSGKSRVVKQYPRGSKQTCYVNPRTPEQAVLRPGLTPFALIALIPLALLVAGGAGMRSMRKKIAKGREEERRTKDDPWGMRSAASSGGGRERSSAMIELKPDTSRVTTAVVVFCIAAFWNGIVSVFLSEVLETWKSGRPDWFQTLFLVPFVLVGLALVLGFFYTVLAMFNPKPIIRLRPGNLRIGEPLRLDWEVPGADHRIKQFHIWIHGVESATFRRGTRTVTDEEIFYCAGLVSTPDAREMVRGSVELSLPHDTMCSFDSGNNKIFWRVMVEGEIGFWPDIIDCHKVEVRGPDTRVAQRSPIESA